MHVLISTFTSMMFGYESLTAVKARGPLNKREIDFANEEELRAQMRKINLEDPVIEALINIGIKNGESLCELLKLGLIERYQLLNQANPIKMYMVDDSKFKEPLRKFLYQKQAYRFGGTSYLDIIAFNLSRNGQFEEISDYLMENFNGVLSLSTFLAGFEFVAVSNAGDFSDGYNQFAGFLLYIAFLLAAFSGVASLLAVEYFRFCKDESEEFIYEAVKFFRYLNRFVSLFAFTSFSLLTVSLPILAYSTFPTKAYTWIITAAMIMLCIVLFALLVVMTMRKQIYRVNHPHRKKVQRYLYEEIDLEKDEDENGIVASEKVV